LISLPIIKYKRIFVTKKQRPELEKPINEEIVLAELRDHLNEIHNESGRSVLEGGSYQTRETGPLMEGINIF